MSQHDTLTQVQRACATCAHYKIDFVEPCTSCGDYVMWEPAAISTPAQAQQPPYAWAVSGASTMFFGTTAEYDARQEAKHRGGTAEAFPLFRAAQPAGDVVRDAERLEWLLSRLPGDALRYCVGELADTADANEFRAAIDSARKGE